jgi:hypothetical protein
MQKRNRQRERWAQAGLLKREQVPQPGKRGSTTQYGEDTDDRCAVIQDYLDHGHTLQQAANELTLQGYDLYKAQLLRHFYLAYCEAQRILLDPKSLYQRHRTGDATLPTTPQDAERAQRTRIRRIVTSVEKKVGLSVEAQDVFYAVLTGLAGILPASIRMVPQSQDRYPPLGLWQMMMGELVDPTRITDAALFQAQADGREAAAKVAPHLGKAISTLTGFSEEEWARFLLPGHGRCTFPHTLAQAFGPLFTLIALFSPEELAHLPTNMQDLRSLLRQANVGVRSKDSYMGTTRIIDVLREVRELEAPVGDMRS